MGAARVAPSGVARSVTRRRTAVSDDSVPLWSHTWPAARCPGTPVRETGEPAAAAAPFVPSVRPSTSAYISTVARSRSE